MKIVEITKSNKVLLALLGIDAFELIKTGQDVIDALNIMLKSQSPQRNLALLPSIENIEKILNDFLLIKFSKDKDLENIKIKIRNILIFINNLKKNIKTK